MPEYRFYQLGRSPLAGALIGILSKALERGLRAYILCASAERMADINARLWTEDPASFLPHGTAAEGDAAAQPILLGTADAAPANGAKLLILTDSAQTAQTAQYDMVCVMLDGQDEQVLAAGRAMWAQAKSAGHALRYYTQTAAGGWEEKAAA